MRTPRASLAVSLLLGAAVLAGPRAAQAAWVSYAADVSSIRSYTAVNVINVWKNPVTVTITFRSEDGTDVASTSKSLNPGESWSVQTASGFTNLVAGSSDFSGYVHVDSTGPDKKLAVWGAIQYPVDGSTALGTSLAVTGTALTWTRAK